MSDYFLSGQGKGSETTASDIYKSQAEVLRFAYGMGQSTTLLYNILG